MFLRIAGCAVIAFASLSAQAQEKVTTANIIEADAPFSSGGAVKLDEMRLLTEVRVHKVEGGSLNGVRYRFYYTDGSGTFAGAKGNSLASTERAQDNWSTSCSKDAMNDSVRCYATIRDLMVAVHKDGSHYLVVGSDHYPGSDVAIRLDKSAPLVVSSKVQYAPPQSNQILGRLKNGMTVSTRYQEWPYKGYKDSTFELYGFEEVYSYLQWAVKHID
jgi:hypothetical protein